MSLYLSLEKECKTATVCLAPGLQLPPEVGSGRESPQSHFHRAQSVTSAVDYEYFDMGIGQVPHVRTDVMSCAWEYQ